MNMETSFLGIGKHTHTHTHTHTRNKYILTSSKTKFCPCLTIDFNHGMYPIIEITIKININKRVIACYKIVVGCSMFCEGNGFVFKLVSFHPSLSKRIERLIGFIVGVAHSHDANVIPTIASR